MDATTLLTALQSRKVSSADVMAATLDRIDEVNPRLNAIVDFRPRAELMEEARQADLQTNQGVLHGLPMAIKDLANVAGMRTTQGSPILADFVPQADDLMVARMRQAGAIFIGKTNTPEFGLGSHTFNPVHGVTRNPYDLTRSCGGSSGGAAVALATGMLTAAGLSLINIRRRPRRRKRSCRRSPHRLK